MTEYISYSSFWSKGEIDGGTWVKRARPILGARKSESVPEGVYSALKLIVFNERTRQLSMETSKSIRDFIKGMYYILPPYSVYVCTTYLHDICTTY